MDKVEMTALAVAVGMNATSKKDEVMAQVSANAQKAKLYDSLIEDTKSKTKNQIEAAIDAEVSAAKESKLITDSQVEMYKGIGVASGVETLKEVFAGMTPVVKLSAKVAPKGKGADNSDDPTAEWSYEDFQDKDPQALGKMHTEDAERFERLHKARK
jgi:phage I-like protein